MRVAAYCRVSTDQEEQLNSFENQVDYYTTYISNKPLYKMAGIYADEGISGTNTKKREQFKKMIADCEAGKIDLVITKSISRFARNTQDCLEYSRRLKNLGIGIFFEKENINTLDATGELLFTILSSLAQDESRSISENCKWGIRTKFKKGISHINTNKFLGYDKDEKGNLVINEEQAEIVRRIYRDFLNGVNPATIVKQLTEEQVPGCQGEVKWRVASILGILTNEKHMGDSLLQKTYTVDFLTKKQVKNNGELEQFLVENSHPGIVSKEEWQTVQLELKRREKFREKYHLKFYGYGANLNPFSCRIICGRCQSIYSRKSWHKRGVHVWQCNKRFKEKGLIGCRGENVKEKVLHAAFIKAWNNLVEERDAHLERWDRMIAGENPLERLRARQMKELAEQPPLTQVIPELVQLVLEKVEIKDGQEFDFYFMEGSHEKAKM